MNFAAAEDFRKHRCESAEEKSVNDIWCRYLRGISVQLGYRRATERNSYFRTARGSMRKHITALNVIITAMSLAPAAMSGCASELSEAPEEEVKVGEPLRAALGECYELEVTNLQFNCFATQVNPKPLKNFIRTVTAELTNRANSSCPDVAFRIALRNLDIPKAVPEGWIHGAAVHDKLAGGESKSWTWTFNVQTGPADLWAWTNDVGGAIYGDILCDGHFGPGRE